MPLSSAAPASRPLSPNTAALAAVCLSSLMFGLEISSVPVILPVLERQLPAGFGQLQWIMNAYTLACTTVLMAAGTFGDRYGRKRVFVAGLLAFAATSLACGLANDARTLIVARFLQGGSGGVMLICGTAVLAHQFRAGRERARAFAAWGVVFGVGLGFGPIVGGGILALADWRWVFLVHVALAAITLWPLLRGVRESRDPQAGRLDAAGIATLSVGVFGLTWCLIQGPAAGFASAAVLAVAAVAAVALIAFVRIETAQAHPMFDFAVFKLRDFSGAMVGAVAMNVSFWPFIVYLPIYFHGVLGYDAFAAGALLLAYTLPTLVMPPLAERLSLRFHPGWTVTVGLFAIGAGFLAMRYGGRADEPGWAQLLPGLLLAGIGLGLTNTPVTNTTTAAVPSERAGMATGMDMSARFISLTVNIAVMGLILLAGIGASLRERYGAFAPAAAERIAAGDLGALGSDPAARQAARAALAHGFDLAMLYGGAGVWLLAALGLAIFSPRRIGARLARF